MPLTVPVDNISFADRAVDAFERQRTSSPFTIFDSQLQFDKRPLIWGESIVGGGSSTFLANESSVRLRTGTASGDKVIRQSFQYLRYQPGKSLMILMTGVIGASKANVRQCIGYFDDQNGVFFEQDGTGLNIVRRSFTTGAAVDTAINQADWNIDKLDGTGRSGITVDPTKAQIFVFDFQWLGVGRVRAGIMSGGQLVYAHEFQHANLLNGVYMTTANLPIRYEIENTGVTGSNTDLIQICNTVISEGGFNVQGLLRSADNGVTGIAVGGTEIPILSIRLKSAFARAQLQPRAASILVTGGGNLLMRARVNGALTGAAFASLGANSIAEADVTATAITGGEHVFSGYVQGKSDIEFRDDTNTVFLGSNLAAVPDILTLTALSTGANTIFAALNFREIV